MSAGPSISASSWNTLATRAPAAPACTLPLAAEILKDPLELDQGDLLVPRTSGLGVTVDEAVVDRYPWIPGPWSYFRTDSPAETRGITSDHSVQWDAGAR